MYTLCRSPAAFFECLIIVVITLHTTPTKKIFCTLYPLLDNSIYLKYGAMLRLMEYIALVLAILKFSPILLSGNIAECFIQVII